MPSEIIILRHGQCTGNLADKGDISLYPPEVKRQSSFDWPLTHLGVQESRMAGVWIRANIAPAFDAYYCSDMARAIQTSAFLGFTDAQWWHDPLLRERDWAGYENMHHTERKAAFEKAGISVAEDSLEWAPPGGESSLELVKRFRAFMVKMHKRYSGKRVVIVSHGGIVQAARVVQHKPEAKDYAAFVGGANYIRNAQVTRYFGNLRVSGEELLYSQEQVAFLREGRWVNAVTAIV